MMKASRTIRAYAALLTAVLATACNRPVKIEAPEPVAARRAAPWTGPEATSLLGRPLTPPPLAPNVQQRREAELEQAEADYQRDPSSEETIIWLGRRLAYLGRFNEAIETFTIGLELHPESYKLLRHRGHRYITIRKFDLALDDLKRAAKLIENVPDEVEPDGQPNRLNIPTSTSHTNIFYHLGLAHYLKGSFAAAHRAYGRCMELSPNDDMLVAAAYWRFLCLTRLLRHAEAAVVLDQIRPQMNIIENHGYHRLLMMFKEQTDASQASSSSDQKDDPSIDLATIGYGEAMRLLLDGEDDAARERMRNVIENTNWAAFGHIASEAELAREELTAAPGSWRGSQARRRE